MPCLNTRSYVSRQIKTYLFTKYNRIRLLFGKEYGVTVVSEPDEGTTVTICVPAVPYTEDNRKILERGYGFGGEEMVEGNNNEE